MTGVRCFRHKKTPEGRGKDSLLSSILSGFILRCPYILRSDGCRLILDALIDVRSLLYTVFGIGSIEPQNLSCYCFEFFAGSRMFNEDILFPDIFLPRIWIRIHAASEKQGLRRLRQTCVCNS